MLANRPPERDPDEGHGFFAWKKARALDGSTLIVKLYIPSYARVRYRSAGYDRDRVTLCLARQVGSNSGEKRKRPNPCLSYKARASEAEVKEVYKVGSKKPLANVRSRVAFAAYDPGFCYRPGYIVSPRHPFDRTGKECAPGIHFFFSREAAEAYIL